MFIISKHSALSSTRQDVFLILTASAAVPPRTQSAAQLPSLAPHDSKARLRVVTKRRGSWRSHVHRARLRSACSYSSYKLPMSGVEGSLPSPFSGGFKGGILFGKRIPPLVPRRTRRSPLSRKRGNKEHPFRAATFPRPGRESCPNCQYGILIPISPLFSLDNMRY